jgi:hypothetical protein
MAVNLTNRIKALLPPGDHLSLNADFWGLKAKSGVKGAVNHLRLPSGNRLTVPAGAGTDSWDSRGA